MDRDDDMAATSQSIQPPTVDPETYKALSVVMMGNKKYKVAAAGFEKYLNWCPADVEARFNYGQCLAKLNQQAEAAKAFEKCFEKDPENVDAAINAAGCYIKLGDGGSAVNMCMLALSVDPTSKAVMYNLNTSLRMGGNIDKAVFMSWQRVEQICPPKSQNEIPRLMCRDADRTSNSIGITFVCVKWGVKYGAEYVNRLASGIRKHLMLPHRFVCFTENPTGLSETIEVAPFPEACKCWQGWWLKAGLFSHEAATVLGVGRRVVYLDLDTVIVNSLERLVAVTSKFGVLCVAGMANERRSVGYNTSIMTWIAGDQDLYVLYDYLVTSFDAVTSVTYKFDHWIEMVVLNADLLQEFVPGAIVEYRSLLTGTEPNLLEPGDDPPAASLVVFPLEPKPHECAGWVASHWRIWEESA